MIKLSGYKIIKKIGSGGMGDVYLAEHEVLETTVAIKSLHANLVTDESFKKRFRTEAKVHAKLDHPNIVKLIDFQERQDGLFIIMEYVEGKQLDDYIHNDSGPIPEKELLSLFAQIVDAISHAHAKGLVHRDIKPANVIIFNGKIKVLDFGIAKEASTESGLTKTGVQVGTPMYMSPEQVNGEKIDKLTDIYSLGVTLFYMAVGKPPYENSNAIKMGIKIISEPFPTAKEFYPGVSDKIEIIIKKASQKNKIDRYQSCEEFKKDLDSKNVVVTEKIKASTKTKVAKKKKKFKLSNIIAFAVVLLLVAGYFIYFDNNANTLPATYLVDGQEITLEDVSSDQVVITDLIWKNKSTMQPVTGRYIDSKGRYGGLIINGLKEGLWREWHANEQLSYEGAYNDGNKEGVHKEWHENGQLAFERTYKDGNQEGFTHKQWDKNGQLVLNKYYKTVDEQAAEAVKIEEDKKKQKEAAERKKQLNIKKYLQFQNSLGITDNSKIKTINDERGRKCVELLLVFNYGQTSTDIFAGPNGCEDFSYKDQSLMKLRLYPDNSASKYYAGSYGKKWLLHEGNDKGNSDRVHNFTYKIKKNYIVISLLVSTNYARRSGFYRRNISINTTDLSALYTHQNIDKSGELEKLHIKCTGYLTNVKN